MNYAIVTGTSRGLGEEVAKMFIQAGIHVIGVARNKNDRLTKLALANDVNYEDVICDLSKVAEVEELINYLKGKFSTAQLNKLYLVNNAAVVNPVNQAMNVTSEELIFHMNVNNIAPMLLNNALLKFSDEKNVKLICANVTSAAALRPVYGWSAYCSSKASINLYTKTVALELTEQEKPSKIIAFNPGIMDTEMQATIRSNDKEAFKDLDRFIQYKESEQLQAAAAVGEVLVDILLDEQRLINGNIYDVHDFLR